MSLLSTGTRFDRRFMTTDYTLGRVEGGVLPGVEGQAEMSEQEIALVVDKFFSASGWETYPEVVLPMFSARPDLAMTRNGFAQIIECKRNLNFSLVEQGARWQSSAYNPGSANGMPHLIWLCVERRKGKCVTGQSWLLLQMINEFRLGLISVSKHLAAPACGEMPSQGKGVSYTIQLNIEARLQPGSRKGGRILAAQLNPDMRIATPGSRGGCTSYMTPFKRTVALIEQILSDGSCLAMTEIVTRMNELGGHHYASDTNAVSSLKGHMPRLGFSMIESGFNQGKFYRAREQTKGQEK